MSPGRKLTVTLCFCIAIALDGSVGADAADYLLGSGDRVRLKVLEWRPGRGEPYEWPGLSGDFAVDDAGQLSLPMLGRVDAAARTAAGLSEFIAVLLQKEAGLVRKPEISLEITEYRPFYIVGDVEKPGAYPYKPGMTSIQAVSVAGGLYRIHNGENGAERDIIAARGEVRALRAERIGLLAAQARLKVEIEGTEEIQFSAELAGSNDDARSIAATHDQRMLFKSRRDSLRSQIDGLDQIKALYANEVETLKGKIQSINRQESLNKTELDSISTLVSQGLAVASRKLALEQSAARFSSERLDLQLSILRAQQAISKADRDKLELVNARRNDGLIELGQVRSKLDQIDEKITTARQLEQETVAASSFRDDDPNEPSATYEIIRVENGASRSIFASETDAIRPGDVLRIGERPRNGLAARDSDPKRSTLANDTVEGTKVR